MTDVSRAQQSGGDGSAGLKEEYLVELAASRAHDKLRKDENKWRAILGVAIAALALFGYTKLSDIEATVSNSVYSRVFPEIERNIDRIERSFERSVDHVKQEINNSLVALVQDNIQYETNQLRNELRLSNFGLLVTKISLQPRAFANADRDNALNIFMQLIEKPEMAKNGEFLGHISTFLETLSQAWYGNYAIIDQISSAMIKNNIEIRQDVVEVLLYHFSQAIPIHTDMDADYLDLIVSILRRSDELSLMELSEFVRLCLNFRVSEGRNDEGEELIRRIANISADEKKIFSINLGNLMKGVASGELSRQQWVVVAWFYIRLDRQYEGRVFDAIGLDDDAWASKIETLATSLN